MASASALALAEADDDNDDDDDDEGIDGAGWGRTSRRFVATSDGERCSA